MVNETQIRQFEDYLITMSGEREELEQKKEPITSVFDQASDPAQQKQALRNVLENAVDADNEDQSTQDERVAQMFGSADEESLDSLEETEEKLLSFSDDEEENEDVATIQSELADVADVEDDIEELEQKEESILSKDEESLGTFVLPEKYQKLSDTSLLSHDEVFSSSISPSVQPVEIPEEPEDEQLDTSLEDVEGFYEFDDNVYQEQNQYTSIRDFSEDDVQVFLDNVDKYNIFVKKAILAVITDEAISHLSQRLVDLVFDSAPQQSVRRECEKLLNISIPVPADLTIYEEETLREKFESPTRTVISTVRLTAFRILPIVASIVAILFFGFVFVVQPSRAFVNYNRGYTALVEKRYQDSETLFIKAADLWSMERFYFKYADEYQRQRRYGDAKKKYLQLVFGLNETLRNRLQELTISSELLSNTIIDGKFKSTQSLVNYSREGFFKLGAFTRDIEGNFEEATKYYNAWILKNVYDVDAYMELGNTFIEWYDVSENLTVLDGAQSAFDRAVIISNNANVPYFLRVRYAIRAQDIDYISMVLRSFMSSFAASYLTPITANAFIELVEYKLNNNQANSIVDLLDTLKNSDIEYPHLDYFYARYYQQINDKDSYRAALERAYQSYQMQDAADVPSLAHAIDTNIRIGFIFLSEEDNIIAAKNILLEAQQNYENFKQMYSGSKYKELSKLYVLQSEIALLEDDISLAQNYLERAEEDGYTSEFMKYQLGVVHYLMDDYSVSADYFLSLVDSYSNAPNTQESVVSQIDGLNENIFMYEYTTDTNKRLSNSKNYVFIATANALYFSHNYAAAVVYYEKALREINPQLRQKFSFLFRNENLGATFLAEHTAYVQNNLGAALYQLSQTSQKERENLRSRAIQYLQEANTTTQNLTRDDFGVRKTARDLPALNINAIIENKPLNIYPDILLSLNGATARYYNPTIPQIEELNQVRR